MQNIPPFVVAAGRAVAGGVIAAGAAFFAAAVQGNTLKASALIAGAAGFAYLVTRGGIEGFYDQGKTA